jgi:hypothetical protein
MLITYENIVIDSVGRRFNKGHAEAAEWASDIESQENGISHKNHCGSRVEVGCK